MVSWDGSRLTISVAKEIGDERGWLEFDDVSHVNFPATLGIEAIEVGVLPPDFFDTYRPCDDRRLEPEEKAFIFHGSGGERYFVVARSITYTVDAPVPKPDVAP